MSTPPRVAVVGHVEWVRFAVVDRVPASGEIVEAHESFELPGGGGGVAAVQLARLAGSALLLTALGDDERGAQAARELEGWGVEVEAARRAGPTRRAFAQIDGAGERAITAVGERIVPHGADELPWARLADCDAVYFTGGDAAALRASRAARTLVATPRARDTLATAGVQVDVLVASAADAGERVVPGAIDPPPRHVVLTEGGGGGGWAGADGTTGRWAAAAPPGPPVDTFGCGDTFAAGLTYALGAGLDLGCALELAARCGAACLTGRGPYGAPLHTGLDP